MVMQLANRDSRQFRVTGPFALARHDEVEIEFTHQRHAMGTRGIVDAAEGFIEQHQARRVGRIAMTVETGDSRE